jgi:hypothetical protein
MYLFVRVFRILSPEAAASAAWWTDERPAIGIRLHG